jgi:hypothetical protein
MLQRINVNYLFLLIISNRLQKIKLMIDIKLSFIWKLLPEEQLKVISIFHQKLILMKKINNSNKEIKYVDNHHKL